jgi:hypothetical protein
MYYILFLVIGIFLGYKLKTLVDFLQILKIKNYVEYFVGKYERSNFKVVNERTTSSGKED